MNKETKISYVQLRVAPSEKKAIAHQAKLAKMGMSQWILSRILPSRQQEIEVLLEQLAKEDNPRFVLAEIHDLLFSLSAVEFQQVLTAAPGVHLTSYWANYLAATVEYAAHQKGVSAPVWTRDIQPLDKPVFVTDLVSLRLHLLFASPPCFRNRNIFIDSSVGARV